ncbi:DNA-binding transcriptional regulator, AcrR family [Mucilaginibacter gossypiicola]|uniref:Biofilm operon icaADBC HTH-type negative transcriptional regulator IcaR n=1 Tax=Mucilaginibacter gossypiicola TaxID=551995 RepID=A0A1H8NQH9_9SPHI|nr:TetR family transcriptional regulator [Mucilaginibacter gossypiicola]SEO31856.1 DNA-binding transcriptional regulator, AcrR family [Mucilaginibacter gossypiicola]
MGRKSLKEARQQEIVKMFYEVAKKEGYENTSIAKIAKVMDINPSLILHYFETKEDLTYALIDHILESYLSIYTIKDKEQATLENLQRTLEMLFSKEWNVLFDDGLFYTFYALAFREEKIKSKYKIILDALRQRLAAIIEQCNEKGLTAIKAPQTAADFIFVLVDGAYFYLSLENDMEAYTRRLSYYKQKAYEFLEIPPLTLA